MLKFDNFIYYSNIFTIDSRGILGLLTIMLRIQDSKPDYLHNSIERFINKILMGFISIIESRNMKLALY